MGNEKDKIKSFWDSTPCGTRNIPYAENSVDYFEAIAKQRYQLEPFIFEYAQFGRWVGKKILEVGCGVGTDLLQFAKAGADVVGLDFSSDIKRCLDGWNLWRTGN